MISEGPPAGQARLAAQMSGVATDLFVTSHTPALGTGRGVRTYAVLSALARLRPVDVLFPVFGAPEPDADFRDIDGVTFHPVVPSRRARRAAAYLAALARGVPQPYARAASAELLQAATVLAGAPGRGRIILDGLDVTGALWPIVVARRDVVYCAHNLESAVRYERTMDAGHRREPARLARFEARVLGTVGESWQVSAVDLAGARALAPGATLRYVPNAVDVARVAAVTPAHRGRILFVANLRYPPNQTALAFLCEQVMPQVWAQCPQATLLVAGRGLEHSPSPDPRVEVLGFVDDLEALYRSADCVAVPLSEGGGSPLKFIEGLAHGLPVVATSVAARGLEAVDGEHFVLADDPAAFAEGLVAALSGSSAAIGARGRTLAQARYSIEALTERVAA